jgi:hypothetical protein
MELAQIIYGLFLAGAVYGGIRADLKSLHERVAEIGRAVSRAHERLDSHVDKG